MLLQFSVILALLMLSSCYAHVTSPPTKPVAITSPTAILEPTPSPTPSQPIRSINFDYVAFPHYPVYVGERGKKKYITLKPGDGGPALLDYGDLTGDGVEEAMMMLGLENRGSAIPGIVYIFTLGNHRPKLLWSFETGDRADGGFRNAYADHGELVVELFGKDRIIGSNLYRGEEGLCCPSSFTRARYEWTGTKFRLKGTPEVLPNPNGGANAVMPFYNGPSK